MRFWSIHFWVISQRVPKLKFGNYTLYCHISFLFFWGGGGWWGWWWGGGWGGVRGNADEYIVGLHREDVCWCGHPLDWLHHRKQLHSLWGYIVRMYADVAIPLIDYITGNSFIHCGVTSWGCMLMWPSPWLVTSQETASFIVGLHREDVCWCGDPLDWLHHRNSLIHCEATSWGCMLMWRSPWLITSQVTASFIVGLHREDVCRCGHPLDWLHHR